MHHIHYTLEPTLNLFLQHKLDIEKHERHRLRIRNIKPSLDNKAPRTQPPLKTKKILLEQERVSAIHKENEILLQKIATVSRSRGTFDNHNEYERKSLNTRKRQKETLELTYSNQAMLRRLLTIGTTLNHEKLNDEYLINQKYRSSIGRYPTNWRELVEQDKKARRMIREKLSGKLLKKKPTKDCEKSSSGLSSGDALKIPVEIAKYRELGKSRIKNDEPKKEESEKEDSEIEESEKEDSKANAAEVTAKVPQYSKQKKWTFAKKKK